MSKMNPAEQVKASFCNTEGDGKLHRVFPSTEAAQAYIDKVHAPYTVSPNRCSLCKQYHMEPTKNVS